MHYKLRMWRADEHQVCFSTGTLTRHGTTFGCTSYCHAVSALNQAVTCPLGLPLLLQIAWRLHRMALNATHEAFVGFAIDGVPKKVAGQSANLWTLMIGSAADNATPTVTLDFDFTWQASCCTAAWQASPESPAVLLRTLARV